MEKRKWETDFREMNEKKESERTLFLFADQE